MPRRMKWRKDGTWPEPRMMDFAIDGLGRFQVQSGVAVKTAYEARKSAVLEDWERGGVWRDGVKAVYSKAVTLSEWYAARSEGVEALATFLKAKGAAPLRPLIADYLKASKATDKRKMRQRLDRLATFLGKGSTVADLTPATVDAFLASLIDQRTVKTSKKPAQGSTVNRYRAVISGLCTWAVRAGRMEAHPIAGKKVEKREEPGHRLPEMSAAEYAEYMGHVRAQRPDLAVVFLLLLHTAPDLGELYNVPTMDAKLDEAQIIYHRTKTRRFKSVKPRRVPLPKVVLTELRGHIAEHELKGSMPLFGMIPRREVENTHERAAKAIQRPELRIKDLRHIAAIAWVKAGVHIRLVQRWLGHASLTETMKYTDYEPDAGMAAQMAERAADTLNQTAGVMPIGRAV